MSSTTYRRLTPNRVAETVASRPSAADWALADAADVVTDRAILVQPRPRQRTRLQDGGRGWPSASGRAGAGSIPAGTVKSWGHPPDQPWMVESGSLVTQRLPVAVGVGLGVGRLGDDL